MANNLILHKTYTLKGSIQSHYTQIAYKHTITNKLNKTFNNKTSEYWCHLEF